MPELLWKEYIGFEIAEIEFERTRQLYGRLLVRTKHLKMCGSATHCLKHLPLKRYNNKETSFRSRGNFVSEGSEGDIIAIGAFKAMEMDVFVSCSAGNSGHTKASLANVAPWIMTVSAETLDRDCIVGKGLVKGKLVFCDRGVNPRVEKGQVVKEAGGVGMLLGNTAESEEELVADSHLLPTVAVGMKIGDKGFKRAQYGDTADIETGCHRARSQHFCWMVRGVWSNRVGDHPAKMLILGPMRSGFNICGVTILGPLEVKAATIGDDFTFKTVPPKVRAAIGVLSVFKHSLISLPIFIPTATAGNK
nr:hypothetical protein [Tanacetum cinerariifolium]